MRLGLTKHHRLGSAHSLMQTQNPQLLVTRGCIWPRQPFWGSINPNLIYLVLQRLWTCSVHPALLLILKLGEAVLARSPVVDGCADYLHS